MTPQQACGEQRGGGGAYDASREVQEAVALPGKGVSDRQEPTSPHPGGGVVAMPLGATLLLKAAECSHRELQGLLIHLREPENTWKPRRCKSNPACVRMPLTSSHGSSEAFTADSRCSASSLLRLLTPPISPLPRFRKNVPDVPLAQPQGRGWQQLQPPQWQQCMGSPAPSPRWYSEAKKKRRHQVAFVSSCRWPVVSPCSAESRQQCYGGC